MTCGRSGLRAALPPYCRRRPTAFPGSAGFALLDALVALAILGTAGIGFLALAQGALSAERASARAEQEMMDANRVLTAASLLTDAELAQRLGEYPVRQFRVRIQRPAPGLYRISIVDSARAEREVLVTAVRR